MKRLFSLLLLLALAALCVGTVLFAWWITNLQTQAEIGFGPPSAALGRLDRILLSARLLAQENELRQPANFLAGEQPFIVNLGESPNQIAQRLQDQGLVKNGDALVNYLVYTGLDTTLQAGEYQLSARMSAIEIANAMQDATPKEVLFTILPGWRLEEIAGSLATSGLEISPDDFIASVSAPPASFIFSSTFPAGVGLEGFLFPDSYRVPRETKADELVTIILEDFQAKLDPSLLEGFQRQGLNLYQAVTLASIVEREAILDEEMPMIASVFLNRLTAGMKLDSDPTVQYALGFNSQQNTWWTNPLSLKNLQIDSLFNTYLYPGLPPGPISNPSLSALQSVAFPAQTPYYFFRAACDGSGRHSFAENFEQHKANACP
jgi:UPF0755 protein